MGKKRLLPAFAVIALAGTMTLTACDRNGTNDEEGTTVTTPRATTADTADSIANTGDVDGDGFIEDVTSDGALGNAVSDAETLIQDVVPGGR